MIELARTRARERQLSVDFIIGDAQAFSFPAQTFDVLVSRFGVMFFDDPIAAFGNLRRATRPPGGRLTFVCWRHPKDNPFMTTAERASAHLLPDLKPVIAGEPWAGRLRRSGSDPIRSERRRVDRHRYSPGRRHLHHAGTRPVAVPDPDGIGRPGTADRRYPDTC